MFLKFLTQEGTLHTNITSYAILLSSRTRLLTPGHTNPNQTEVIRIEAIKAKRTKAATRIEFKTRLVQRFPYTLRSIHRAIEKLWVAILHKMALKNP